MRRARRAGGRRPVRRLGLALLVALLAVSLATPLIVKPRAQPVPGEEFALAAADKALADAIRSGDRSIARRLLSLQFAYTDEAGRVFSRRDFLGDLKNFSAVPASDPKVTMYGLLATVTGDHKPADGGTAFFFDIWVKQKRAWRALARQDVVLAEDGAASAAQREDGKGGECANPCEAMPYRVRSPAEQEVVNSFLAIEKASLAHDAQEWSRHVADEFVLYRTGNAPINKAERVAAIERQKEAGALSIVGQLQDVHLSVYGDAAAMTATERVPDNTRPPYRATRVWVKRNGQWLMTISVQTDIQPQ